MIYEKREQSMAWMEHGHIIQKMEDEMAAEAFGRATNCGRDGLVLKSLVLCDYPVNTLILFYCNIQYYI